jgi:hypothetical protein
MFITSLDKIQYKRFPHNAVEIGEVFESWCNEVLAVINGAAKILSIFSGYFF